MLRSPMVIKVFDFQPCAKSNAGVNAIKRTNTFFIYFLFYYSFQSVISTEAKRNGEISNN